MRKYGVLLGLLLVWVGSSAWAQTQDRYLRRLDGWYTKGRYEQVVRKSSIYTTKNPESPWGYAHTARAHLALASASQGRRQLRHLEEALQAWQAATRRGATESLMPQVAMELEYRMRELALLSYEDERSPDAKFYQERLSARALTVFRENEGPGEVTVLRAAANPAGLIDLNELPDWARNPQNPITFPAYVPLRDSLLAEAAKWQGTPYKWAGEKPSTGFDCSGFVLYVMRTQGYDFLHGTAYLKDLGWVISEAEAQPGDFVFFGYRDEQGNPHVNHMGMLYEVGEGQRKVIHSVSRGVVIDDLNEGNYWTKKILFFRNIVDVMEPPVASQ